MPYYNTTGSTGETLQQRRSQARTQKQIVASLLRKNPRGLTPSEVYTKLNSMWPITSVRRALTDLTNEGVATKTPMLRRGMYGREEHIWELAAGVEVDQV